MLSIRITFPYDKLKTVFSKIKEVSDKVVVYQHDATRIHIHALVVGLRVSTDTLKNWTRKEVGQVAKTDWSFTAAQDEKFITYMSKGTLAPVFVSGYDMDQLDLFRSQWVAQPRKNKELIQYRLKIENPREQRLRQDQMMQMIAQRYKEEVQHHEPSVLLRIIRQVVVIENKTVLGRYKARDYYDSITAIVYPETWVDKMENFVAFRT